MGIQSINNDLFRNEKSIGTGKPLKNSSKIIINDVNQYISDKNNSFSDNWIKGKGEGFFSPSMLGDLCDKLLYLHFKRWLQPDKVGGKLQRIFDHGHATEERFTQYFREMNILKDRELHAASLDPPIKGRVDFLLERNNKEMFIVELKTINDRGFVNLIDSPKYAHLVQLQIYLNVLDIDDGFVLYENKNDQDLKEFHIIKDKEFWNDIKNRCYKIQNMTSVPEVVDKGHSIYCRCKEWQE